MPRPYDLHCVRIIKSDDLDNDCAKLSSFWHNRVQCKSYQRWASSAAVSRRLHALVRPSLSL
jgi:hypothetical protein